MSSSASLVGGGANEAGVAGRPCPYRARAWWGDRLVAETTSARRVEEADRAPVLWFPPADVRYDLLRDDGRTDTDPAGTVARWSVAVHTSPITPSMMSAIPKVRITDVDAGLPWIQRIVDM